MMSRLYKGYVKVKGKSSMDKFKDVPSSELRSLNEARKFPEYGGVLADDVILVDIDNSEQSEILMDIVEDCQLDCRVIDTEHGKHFLFKNREIRKCKTGDTLAIGLTADIKVGCVASYEVLKKDGEERFVEWDVEPDEKYQDIPKWLFPIGKMKPEFLSMGVGDGRNQSLFNYILTLTGNGFTIDETRETIRIINKYVLKESLSDEELEVILRDDAFQKPAFFNDKTFLFDKFALYLIQTCHIVKINNQLHVYKDGVYSVGYKEIEKSMIEYIPNLRDAQRREVLKYLELVAQPMKPAAANYIAFKNGIYDLRTNTLLPFSPEYVLTNKINWNYDPTAYCELTDNTLNKIACQDAEIRALLEECIGYCFYRRNEMRKAFILVGGKRNGKSTFLDCIKEILGDDNISALDLNELGDRFSTSMMFGKLANIGDDIGDDFLQGSQVAVFKKITAGNRIKAERKGQDPFEFNPYVKLLFSANKIPRMKDRTGAVLDRLIIIPFDATFRDTDPDYRKFIKYDLIEPESLEYLIRIGIEGLNRVLDDSKGFTKSNRVQKQIDDYNEENNPILAFLSECDVNEILNEPTSEVYRRYDAFCKENNMNAIGNIAFSREICRRLNLTTNRKTINGKLRRVFERA